jgi:hypothetical protein
MQLPTLIPTGLMKEVYGDLAKPGMENVGKAIGNILGLGNTALLPIHLLNERAKMIVSRNLEQFRKRLEQEKPEDIVEPAPEIAVPILERLSFVSDEKIAELYIALLSSACNRKFKGCAHPAFIKIIEALSPDEALILKFLAEHEIITHETLRAGEPTDSGYDRLSRFVSLPKELGLTFPDNATFYCENLEGLGILRDGKGPLANDSHYDSVRKVTERILKKWNKEQPGLTLTRICGHYHITRFGVELVIACGHNDPKITKDLLRFWPKKGAAK